jgi:hypothetical protein
MACGPDGTMVALGLYEGSVILMDGMTGREPRRARLHAGAVGTVASTAGDHLLTVGGEGRFDDNARALRPIRFTSRGFASDPRLQDPRRKTKNLT